MIHHYLNAKTGERNVSEKLWQIAIETVHRHLPMGMSSATDKKSGALMKWRLASPALPKYNGGSHRSAGAILESLYCHYPLPNVNIDGRWSR